MLASALILAITAAGLAPPDAPAPAAAANPPSILDRAPANFPGLHNVVAYADGIYSGSFPEGDAGFSSLRALGIRTVISVDGARPDLARAHAAELRYVHLPISYSGVPAERGSAIARALRELPHPIYIHCHHGKHRSAAAAAVAVIALDLATPEECLERMKVSGTSARYTGLFNAVRTAEPMSDADLAAADASFPELWEPQGMVAAMVEAELAFGHLRDIERAGWRTPIESPDLVPAAEAGRLANLLRVLLESDEVKSEPADFLDWLRENADQAQELEDGLAAAAPADRLSSIMKRLDQTCKDCHAKYRDTDDEVR